MSLEKRDVLAVYPRRKMECSEVDFIPWNTGD